MEALFLLANLAVGDLSSLLPYARVMPPSCFVLEDLDVMQPFEHPEYSTFYVYCDIEISEGLAVSRLLQYATENDLPYRRVITYSNGVGTEGPDYVWQFVASP